MDETTEARAPETEAPADHGERAADDPAPGAPPHVCNVGFCPIGLALTAVQPMRPDAVEHLLAAGREFLLAMRAVVDARAEGFEGEGAPDFEKIDLG
jgi:hypothetical protein